MYIYMHIYILQLLSVVHRKPPGVYIYVYTCTCIFCNYFQSCTANHQVCIHVYIHAHIYFHTYISTSVHVYKQEYASRRAQYTCIEPSIVHSKLQVYVYTHHVYIYVHRSRSISTYVYIYTYASSSIQLPSIVHSKPPGIYICMFTHIYIFIHIYMHIFV